MEPVFRILDHGTAAVAIRGMTKEQASLMRDILAPLPSSPDIHLSISKHPDTDEVVLAGTPDQLRGFLKAMAKNLRTEQLSKKINTLLDNYLRSDYKIKCRGTVLDLNARTHIMGILNVTPDSFSDGGRYADAHRAVDRAREMAAQGADIIDIGGESTRPGARPLSEDEELARIIPVIRQLAGELSTPLSVDTYKSRVAEKALAAGASIVNDISGLRFSPDMAKVAADHGAVVVIMHIKGTPRDMQKNPVYADVVAEVAQYLEEGVATAVSAGVDRERVLIDPGIGFGKTLGHNLTLLERLGEFRAIGRPILLGTSRKKFIGTVLDAPEPELRLEGTAATVALGIERGARIVRVHDVAQMVNVARMTDAILKAKYKS
jgi:dihydropteroate synthase